MRANELLSDENAPVDVEVKMRGDVVICNSRLSIDPSPRIVEASVSLGRVIKGKNLNSCFVIDLTSLSYPSSGRAVVAELDKGNAVNILLKISELIPMRQVVQIDVEDGAYRLYTGVFNGVEVDAILELHQLCYMLNRTNGTITVEICKLMKNIATVKTLENYVRKDDKLLLNCGNSKT